MEYFDVVGITIQLPNGLNITIPTYLFMKYTNIEIPESFVFETPEEGEEFLYEVAML